MSTWRERLSGATGAWLLGIAASLPLLTAGLRAIRGSWYPIGDNAFFALRASDVLTRHNPLLGTWTSASLTVDRRLNNPGPLLFDWLAAPVRIDVAAGTVVGVVALHVLVLAMAMFWAHRAAGLLGAASTAAAFGALEWSMGSEILVEPWQPHSLLPAFLTYLVLVWAVVDGHVGALPWAALVASLVLQTHLSYGVLVPGLALLALAAVALRARRPGGPGLRAPLAASALIVLVTWLQPLYDLLLGSGNLWAVVTGGGGGDELAGPRFAARMLGSVAAVPGGWTPDGFSRLTVDLLAERAPGEAPVLEGISSGGTVMAWGVLAAVVVVTALLVTWQRRDRALASGLLVAGVATCLTLLTLALLPVSPLLGVAAHQVRPVWPVVLFATALVVAALLRSTRHAAAVMAAAGMLLVGLALPAHNPQTGPSADAWAIPLVRDLVSQLDAVEDADLVLVDLSVIRFAEPFSTPVMLELERRGVEFVVDDDIAIGQLGVGRAHRRGDPVDLELRIVDGAAASTPAEGWERIAFVDGPSPKETAAVLVREV